MPNYPKDQQLKPVTFSDFSPGIVQRTGAIGATQYSPARIGAASPTNTYRCIALPGGGLGPLPKRTTDLKFTDLTGVSLANGVTVIITGFFIFGPLYKAQTFISSGVLPPFDLVNGYEAHIAFEYVLAGTQTHQWRRYPYYSGAAPYQAKSVNLPTVSNVYAPTYFTSVRAIPGGLAGAYPIVVGSWVSCQDTPTTSYTSCFPDPASPGFDGTADVFSGFSNGGPVLGHQDRSLVLNRELFLHGGNSTSMPINETIIYTLPSDIAFEGSAEFGEEFPVGYGAWGSLSSSDLLLIKHSGGAYLVQGDINTPIVRRFPGVTSTAGVETVGASTSIGFVYGVGNDGVYAWQGGDSSQHLSPQLEPGFWEVTPPLSYAYYRGTFMGWGDWIMCPNNYLFDINSQSWWNIEDPSFKAYYIWQRQPGINAMIGAPMSATNADNIYASVFDKRTLANSYSWQSQPFNPDQRRRVRTRAVSLVAQGSGTVTITVVPTDSGEATPTQPNAYTVNTSGAVRQIANAQAAGTEFILRIVSDGGSNPAPIVHEVSIDFEALSQPTMAS